MVVVVGIQPASFSPVVAPRRPRRRRLRRRRPNLPPPHLLHRRWSSIEHGERRVRSSRGRHCHRADLVPRIPTVEHSPRVGGRRPRRRRRRRRGKPRRGRHRRRRQRATRSPPHRGGRGGGSRSHRRLFLALRIGGWGRTAIIIVVDATTRRVDIIGKSLARCGGHIGGEQFEGCIRRPDKSHRLFGQEEMAVVDGRLRREIAGYDRTG